MGSNIDNSIFINDKCPISEKQGACRNNTIEWDTVVVNAVGFSLAQEETEKVLQKYIPLTRFGCIREKSTNVIVSFPENILC